MSIASWSVRHAQAFLGATGRLTRQPLASLFTVAVIALALAVPVGLWVLVQNARGFSGDLSGAVDLSVYFKTDVPLAKAEQLARSARSRPEVASVTLISAEQGLAEFRAYSGFAAALGALDGNPLPHVLNIRPRGEASGPEQLAALRAYLAAWPEVEVVQLDSAWVARFDAILRLLRALLAVATGVLGVGVLAVIGNTIRLEIAGRSAEIEVTRLVGGTNGFIRRPFLYTGALYGFLGAVLAWAIVTVAADVLAAPVDALAKLYGSHFALHGVTLGDLGALLLGGTALGWVGAWVMAARQLSPRPRT